jgi:hypothetical protein
VSVGGGINLRTGRASHQQRPADGSGDRNVTVRS